MTLNIKHGITNYKAQFSINSLLKNKIGKKFNLNKGPNKTP